MTGMKPSVDMIMNRKVSGHSPAHVAWEKAKKTAAQQGADVSKLPKMNLGPLLDDYRQYMRGAAEVAQYYKDLGDKTLTPLKNTRNKIITAARTYRTFCEDKSNDKAHEGLSPAVKKAWGGLATAARLAEQVPDNSLSDFNRELKKEHRNEVKLQ
jgi:hypothetical protein